MKGNRDLAREIRAALANDSQKGALQHAVNGINEKRRDVLARFPGYEQARDAARAVKERAIAELPALIDRFSAALQANGGQVHQAADGEQACRIIADIARARGAQRITKSKSMTSEEIHLNAALEAAGMKVRETDLGEYIVQLAGDRPSHVTAPIIHMSVNDVRRVFAERLGVKEVPQQPAELTQLARQKLRADFLAADLGITGANFLLADTGTVVIVENEGNARLTTQIPATHVVLAGIEKLIPVADDLLPFLQLLPRSSTGQLLTAYLSFISGPGWAGSPMRAGTARELHVVLLDNGRTAMRADALLREALYCIRCGACMTVCPPYQVVGGHVYGGPTYPSGIGNAWEAGVSGLDTAAEFNALCTTCSRCQDVCPLRIDIPWMNTVIRERIAERDRRPRRLLERLIHDRLFPTEEEGSVSLAARLFADPRRAYARRRRRPWSTLMGMAPARQLLVRATGLAAARALPVPDEQPFTAWYRQHRGRIATKPSEAQRLCSDRRASTVFLFADCHTEHVDTEVGKATVSALEKSGLAVVLVSGLCCGRAALSQGMLRTARARAKELQATLAPAVETGHRVVGMEPSCLAAVADDHPKLLPGALPRAVAAACRDVLQVLHERARECEANGRPLRWKTPATGEPTRAVLHGHCQQKTLGWMPAATELLRGIPGVDLQVTTAECCGMAGSFGYKSDFYPLSVELGERLIAELDRLGAGADAPEKAPGEGCRYLACGTSCRSQISDLGGRRACHPVQLIDERLVKR